VGTTATAKLLPAALAVLLGCGGDASGPVFATARLDYIDGAIEPILTRGQRIVLEGFGFGAARGSGAVRFPRAGGGGDTEAPVADSAWGALTITTTVPDSAASGTLTVITAAGRRLTATVHVLPAPTFNPATLTWQPRPPFPRAPVGVALAAAEFPAGAVLNATLYAAGGGEPFDNAGQITIVPDSGVYVARAVAGGAGAIDTWVRQRDTTDATRSRVLPVPRAFAAAAVATRYNSRLPGSALYVIGGVDAAGHAQATVLGAEVTADSVNRRFVFLEPLPTPVAGAIAVVRRGRIYVIGGTDARKWYGLPPEQRRQTVLDNLANYFGESARKPLQYIENGWAEERFSRGDPVAGLPPGVLLDFGTALRAPVGRIHWAGTETSDFWVGYMDGAVRSGERAAKEVLAELP